MKKDFIFLKITFVIIAFLLLLIATTYLAGFIFLLISKTNPFKADLTTYYQYWHYYYHVDVFYQKRLHIAGIMSIAITLCTPLMLYFSFKREQTELSLFGNAHWASRFEAKKAGLLENKGLIVGKKMGKIFNGRRV